MLQGSIITLIAILVIASLAWALLIVWRRGWFVAWLKGMWVMALLSMSFTLILSLIDFASYRNLTSEVPIATISIYQLDDQYFDLTLIDQDGLEQRYEMHGDQWQLDARLFSWKGPFAAVGAKPLYRLDRLTGRFVSLEQARSGPRSVYQIEQSGFVDIWNVANIIDGWLDAHYGSAVYMPMVNGAVYAVSLTATGMIARPMNDVSKQVIGGEW